MNSFSGLSSVCLFSNASLFKPLHRKAKNVFPLFRELNDDGERLSSWEKYSFVFYSPLLLLTFFPLQPLSMSSWIFFPFPESIFMD